MKIRMRNESTGISLSTRHQQPMMWNSSLNYQTQKVSWDFPEQLGPSQHITTWGSAKVFRVFVGVFCGCGWVSFLLKRTEGDEGEGCCWEELRGWIAQAISVPWPSCPADPFLSSPRTSPDIPTWPLSLPGMSLAGRLVYTLPRNHFKPFSFFLLKRKLTRGCFFDILIMYILIFN